MIAASTLRRLVAAAVTLLLLAVTAVHAPPAHAETRPLEFSYDGVHWTSATPSALFGHDVVLVPGGSATATLHLRSVAPTPGLLDVSLTNVRISDDEAGHAFGLGTVTDAGTGIDGAGEGLPRTRFAELRDRTPVGPVIRLVPGQSARFILTIDFEPAPHGGSARSTAVGLDVAIAFRDAAGGGEAAAPPGAQPPPLVFPVVAGDERPVPAIPGAGTSPSVPERPTTAPFTGILALTGFTRTVFLIVATGMIASGLVLLLASRRREGP